MSSNAASTCSALMSSNKCDKLRERNVTMNTVETLRPSDVITFDRDCEGTQIPSGSKVTVPKGTEAYVGQTLGGNVTLQIPAMGLVQVMHKDVDALLKDGVPLKPTAGSAQAPATEEIGRA